MKKAFFTFVLLLGSSLSFASTWSVYVVQVKQSDAPAVASALDKCSLMSAGRCLVACT